MNAQRLLHSLAQVKIALKQKHFYSDAQLKVFRKTHKRLIKELKQFTNPKAPARQLPPPPQLRLL